VRRPKKKTSQTATTEETIRELFPEEAIEKAKEVAAESGQRVEPSPTEDKSKGTLKKS